MHARKSAHRVVASAALATVLALLPATSSVAYAQGNPNAPGQAGKAGSIAVPVAGTATEGAVAHNVAGTFTIQRFAESQGQIFAVGTLVGTVTSATPGVAPRTFVTQTAMRMVMPNEGSAPAALAAPGDVTALATCDVLNLVLGPLDLNLLGLEIHLNQVVLDIVAVTGAGNLLGNLLCAITGLLDGAGALGQIVTLLNSLLAILG
jgi:hypothetical protein